MIETSVVSFPIASLNCAKVDMPARIDWQPSHAKSFPLFQKLERMQHRVMLRRARHQMFPALGQRPRQADDREVVRLRPAAR